MTLDECTQYISEWFLSDTVELLDLVIADDCTDPQYSAITTLNRFWVYLQYQQQTTGGTYACHQVDELLTKLGYTPEDIALFRKKAQKERKLYTADILDPTFF